MVLELQLFLIIPRILETLLFLVIILQVNKQFKLIPFQKRPLVHKLFLQGLIGWIIYIFLDIFIYTYASLSFDPNITIRAVGYNLEYPSLFIFNILRDIAFAGLMAECWSYLFVPIAIYKGERKVYELWNKKLIKIFIIAFSIFMVLNENLVVQTEANHTIIITEDYEGIGALSLLSATILFSIAALLLQIVMKKSSKEKIPVELLKKIRFFIWGIAVMALGYMWAIFWNSMYAELPILAEPFYYLAISYVIHFFWMSSPILIYNGLKIKIQYDDDERNF